VHAVPPVKSVSQQMSEAALEGREAAALRRAEREAGRAEAAALAREAARAQAAAESDGRLTESSDEGKDSRRVAAAPARGRRPVRASSAPVPELAAAPAGARARAPPPRARAQLPPPPPPPPPPPRFAPAPPRNPQRSPFVTACKAFPPFGLADAREAPGGLGGWWRRLLSSLLHALLCLSASFLTLFVSPFADPGQSSPAPPPAAPAPAALRAWLASAALPRAAFALNALALAGFLALEAALLAREVGLLQLCDEDRGAPWAALSAQLAAYPRAAARLDWLNWRAARAAGAQAALLAVNWALSCAAALRGGAGGPPYRAPCVLLVLAAPAAARTARALALCRECGARRLALPFWGCGFVSLNVLDEKAAGEEEREGEEEEDGAVNEAVRRMRLMRRDRSFG